MKHILIQLLLLLPFAMSAHELDQRFALIPSPQKIEVQRSSLYMGDDLRFIIAERGAQIPILGKVLDALPQSEKRGTKGIRLSLVKRIEGTTSDEAYTLRIDEKGVQIQASSQKGIFYGCQTLEQMLEDSRDFEVRLPKVLITDYPKVSFRAIHLDTKHHLDRMEYYYRMVDKLSSYKINAIIWELEDKLRYTSHPEVAANNAISIQEMQAFCRYAKERNIEVNPLVQGLGHASYLLKHHWELRENPQSDWELCPSNPKSYDLLFDLYKDAIEAMPYGRYLHVGGDEITQIGIDERCKATGKTAFELQMIWLNKVCEFAAKEGRTVIFWDDMPLKYGQVWDLLSKELSTEELDAQWSTRKLDEAIELFPKNCVYMRWNYGDPTSLPHQRLLKWYHDKQLKVMGATAASAGDSPYLPRNNTRVPFIKEFNKLVANNHLEGILATAWDDGSPHMETIGRGFIAHAEYGWNPHKKDISLYNEAYTQREFGLPSGKQQLAFLNELEQAMFFFDSALIVEGRRNPAWGVKQHRLIDLPLKHQPRKWVEKYHDKVAQAEKEALRFEKIQAGIQKARTHALRNRYTLDIYAELNALQHFPVRLLLALRDYDLEEAPSAKAAAMEKIKEVHRSFQPLKAHLEEVYSRTRFLEQPQGYVTDYNHHNHLAIKTLNNDWMYLYELGLLRQMEQWFIEQE